MQVLVRRGNVELEINADFLNQYLAKGFDQVDTSTGKVVKKGQANNFNSLQLAYVDLNKEKRQLEIENLKLKNEVEELKKELERVNASKKNSTTKTSKE